MRKRASSRKASSIALTILLMIIVTFVGGIFVYNYKIGSVQSMTSNVKTQISVLLLESVSINHTNISVRMSNTVNSIVRIGNADINNQIDFSSSGEGLGFCRNCRLHKRHTCTEINLHS